MDSMYDLYLLTASILHVPFQVKAFEDFSNTKKPIASWHNKTRVFEGIPLEDIVFGMASS